MKILRFTAKWCTPCKSLEKLLQEIGVDGKQIEVLDIDQTDRSILMQYGVRSVPTMIKIDENGHVLGALVGLHDRQKLTDWIKN